MMRYKTLVYLLLIFSGCTKEVEVNIPQHEPKLVVDGRIQTDDFPIVLLSKSRDIYAPTDADSLVASFESDAVVTVSDGQNTVALDLICTENLPPAVVEQFENFLGIEGVDLENSNFCLYTTTNPALKGVTGRTYTLNITHEATDYEASTTLLDPVPLDTLYWEEDPDNPGNGFCWGRLSDPSSPQDAYFWEAKRIHQNTDGTPVDALFENTFNPAFDDAFFNGKTFDFPYENPQGFEDESLAENERGWYQEGDSVVVKFSKIDYPVYDFLEKKYTQLQTGGSPFATPLNLPSNISNGARGVWAGYSTTFDTLYCTD
ncbi:MAG: DUF4249 domain-containing protein [Bacteroidota bacterium]